MRGDASVEGQIPTVWGPTDCVLVHNDPNVISDYALTEDLVSRLPQMSTVISTLGCNVAGLKRLGLEERRGWVDLVNVQIGLLQPWQDMMLASLPRDDAQWMYAVNTPTRWRGEVEKQMRQAFKDWKVPLDIAWLRADREGVVALARRHFLTIEETRAGVAL